MTKTELNLTKYARGIIQLGSLSVAEFNELNAIYEHLVKDMPIEERPMFDSSDFKELLDRELSSRAM